MERFNPSKMTKAKHSVTWIDVTIKRLVKQRHKLYLRARNTKDPDIKIHYKRFRAHVHKVLRDAFWKYVSSIFLRLRTTSQIPTLLSLKRFKSFGHFFVVLVQQSIFSLSPPLSLSTVHALVMVLKRIISGHAVVRA